MTAADVGPQEAGAINVGHGVWMLPRWDMLDGDEVWIWHHCPGTGGDQGLSRLPIGERGWTVVQDEPLTLSPSVACRTGPCTLHGWIRDGHWQPA